jgi:hypothetical protein
VYALRFGKERPYDGRLVAGGRELTPYSPYGVHRVVEPPGVLPQQVERLDPSEERFGR